MTVPPYLRICQYTAFIVAIFSNSLLLYLIRIRADKAFGRYRIMMASFSIYSIVYAVVEILTQPVTYIHGSGSVFYVDSFLKKYYAVGIGIASVYCGMFSMCISMLAMQFIYRYIAVCKPSNLRYFEGKSIILWYIFPLCLFLINAYVMFSNSPTSLTRDYFRSLTRDDYNEDIDKLPYLAPLYFIYLEDGTRVFQVPDIVGAFVVCGIINLCFGTCVLCACKTYKVLNDVSIRMSPRTRSLSKQLFWTLFLQTLLPCCTQYLPVGLVFLLPLFEVEVGRIGNLVGVACCLYPALDPLIAIFMIDKFRNCLIAKKKVTIVYSKSSRFSASKAPDFQMS